MPALAKLTPHAQYNAPFHHMALEVHKLLNKPVGTENARVLKLAEVLKSLAETNYQRGHEDAMSALEIVPEEVESERAIYNASKDVAIAFMEANPFEQFRVNIQAKAEVATASYMTVADAQEISAFYAKHHPDGPETEIWKQARDVLLAQEPT